MTNSQQIIDEKTVLVFDEFIVNENWEEDEYRAFNQFCDEHGYQFEVIAVSLFTKQVACRIMKSDDVAYKNS